VSVEQRLLWALIYNAVEMKLIVIDFKLKQPYSLSTQRSQNLAEVAPWKCFAMPSGISKTIRVGYFNTFLLGFME